MVIPPLLLATMNTIVRICFSAVMGVTKHTIYHCTQMARAMPVPASCQCEKEANARLDRGAPGW